MKISGKKVMDAKKPILLEITPKDVTSASSKDAHNCAVAIAVKRQMHVKDVRVHLSKIYVETEAAWIRYDTPQSIKQEIVSFDRAHTFDPGGPRPYHHVTNVRASTFSNVWAKKAEKNK